MSTPKKTTRPDGTQEWRPAGIRHRLRGPAIVRPDGTRAWYSNGLLHRADGPAAEYGNGTRAWYVDGKLQRVERPQLRERTRRLAGLARAAPSR
ncbi:MAG: hypothetical protein F4057_09675 [Acidobacteria bacterium]|nr:hypothetical protein [Acidobacteriota bacterium]MYI75558.1 hypothetical protein [Acidobacteriota bacterium]